MYIAAAMARTSSAGLPALLAIPSGCAWGVSKWFIGEVDSLGAFFLQDAGKAPPGLPPQQAPPGQPVELRCLEAACCMRCPLRLPTHPLRYCVSTEATGGVDLAPAGDDAIAADD